MIKLVRHIFRHTRNLILYCIIQTFSSLIPDQAVPVVARLARCCRLALDSGSRRLKRRDSLINGARRGKHRLLAQPVSPSSLRSPRTV